MAKISSNCLIYTAEFAAFEIADGLEDFFGSIHHKRTIADDRFVNRNAGEQKDFDFFAAGFYIHVAAVLFKADQLSCARLLFAV